MVIHLVTDLRENLVGCVSNRCKRFKRLDMGEHFRQLRMHLCTATERKKGKQKEKVEREDSV